MRILIKNGRVIDPANNLDGVTDILVDKAKISRIEKDIKADADKIIDASGNIVMPGIVDLHVHLREPGREDKETIFSGTSAALKGGVTSLLAMPNTDPAMDCAQSIRLLKKIIKKTAKANVFISGAITNGRLGQSLTDIAGLKNEGAIAITDDGVSVDSAELLLKAFKKAKAENILAISHCEDKHLSNQGVVNLGAVSTRLGLRGVSNESEYLRVRRDIELAAKAKCPVHIAHVSCRESVEIIAWAKKKKYKVSAETAPHYFALDEEAVLGYDANMKMNPPLRAKEDVRAIKQGLKDGTIEVIASDHAPHTENEKEIEFDRAEFGVIGLESEFAVSITELVHTGLLSWEELVRKLSFNPARVLGIGRGTLSVGSPADIAIVSPDKEWVLEKKDIVSLSKNSAFLGRKFKGRVEYTILAGEIVYKS